MSRMELDPSHIMQVGMGFWASKTLLSAVELVLFTRLGDESMTGEAIGEQLGLHPRAIADFLDTLVALRFLDRDGDGIDGRYRNTPETATFLNKQRPTYVGGLLEMANARLDRFWGDLTEALRTGDPQTRSSTRARRCSLSSTATRPGLSSSWQRCRAPRLATSTPSPRRLTSPNTKRFVMWAAPPASCARSWRRVIRICAARVMTCRRCRPTPRKPSPPPASTSRA